MPPIYVTKNGTQHGPFTLAELDQMLQAETFTGEDLYWHQGLSGWQPISKLPGYVPPPISTAQLPRATPPRPVPSPLMPPNIPAPQPPTPPRAGRFHDPTKTKQAYVDRIRAASAYPAYRSLVGIFVVLVYVVGAICILGSFIGGVIAMFKGGDGVLSGLGLMGMGLLAGLVYIVVGRVVKEASLMLADIADTLLDHHSQLDQTK